MLINFDESVLTGTTGRCYSWAGKECKAGRNFKTDVSGLSIMLAITSSGDIFFEFMDGNNNECSVSSFFLALGDQIDKHHPDWRETHLLLLDNCPSHKTALTMKTLEQLDVPVIFSGPASFKAIPVEGMFGAIKAIDFAKIADPDPRLVSNKHIKKFTQK